MHCIARLDYDTREALREAVLRMRFMLRLPWPDPRPTFQLQRHRTRRGWHVEIFADMQLTPAETVALQAILGSDFRREGFNFYRARRLEAAPKFWRVFSHWNVLHKEPLA